MRIAIISDLRKFPWAGCEELWAVTAQRALESGHKVAFFQSRAVVSAVKLQPLIDLGLEVVSPGRGLRLVGFVRERISWKLGSLLAPLARSFEGLDRFSPDIVLINAGDALPEPNFLEELTRANVLSYPYVLACHNSYLFGAPADQADQRHAAAYYQGARMILFVAARTHRETEHLLAAKLDRVKIVRNPINMEDAGLLPMPSGTVVRIASIGRLAINSKGQDVLLAALGSAQFRHAEWVLSIYGDGPHRAHLEALARFYGIAEKVHFKGHVGDVRAIWAENHLLALPSRNESAPLVIVEAMLCGRPSVVTDVGGVCEWISEPATGFVSEGNGIDSFRAALERSWLARAEWGAIGARAREKALGMVSRDPGGDVLKILESVAAQTGANPRG